MSDVNIQIAGRRYTVACGDGEEAHIAQLGRIVDEKLAEIPNLSSQSETRALLFAALLLADDLHEANRKSAAIVPAQQDQAASAQEVSLADAMERLALRMESLASQLESAAGNA